MPTIHVNGFDMYYEDGGQGPAVVYIHGGFASIDTTFQDLKPYNWTWERDFAEVFHFITYDRRGCYRSSCPGTGYDLANQARDLECLLDHLNVPLVHVIGSSAGGPIATVFAASRPQRVRSLALAGTALDLFRRGDPVSEFVREYVAILEQVGAEAAFDRRPAGLQVTFKVFWEPEEMAERGTLDSYWQQQKAWSERAKKLPRDLRVQYYMAELRNMQAYMDAGVAQYARRIGAPTLVLHGSNDREVPLDWGEEMAHTIPDARFQVEQGKSHTLVGRDAEARRKVIDFIRQQEALYV